MGINLSGHGGPLGQAGLEYVADVCRENHGDSLLARDFPGAVRLASGTGSASAEKKIERSILVVDSYVNQG